MEALERYSERFGRPWVERREVTQSFMDWLSKLPDSSRPHKDTEMGETVVRLKPLNEFRTLFEEPGRFLLIQSEEITDLKTIHVNATNLVEHIPPQRGYTAIEIMRTYSKNAFSVTGQAQYTGRGRLNNQNRWIGPGESILHQEYNNGAPFGDPVLVEYAPNLARTTTQPETPSYTTLNVNLNYDFGLSRMQLDRFENLNVYLNIENIGDRIPTFFSGVDAGGINAALFSGMGRQYRMGVRMEF
jgi:hypothetical protein